MKNTGLKNTGWKVKASPEKGLWSALNAYKYLHEPEVSISSSIYSKYMNTILLWSFYSVQAYKL